MLEELKEAREWVHRGWTQGAYWKDALGVELHPAHNQIPQVKSCCAVGALRLVSPDETACSELMEVLVEQLAPQWQEREGLAVERLIDWNDSPDRIKRDVMEAFNLAVEYAEAWEALETGQ